MHASAHEHRHLRRGAAACEVPIPLKIRAVAKACDDAIESALMEMGILESKQSEEECMSISFQIRSMWGGKGKPPDQSYGGEAKVSPQIRAMVGRQR